MPGFDYNGFNKELKEIERGDLKQFQPIVIDVSTNAQQRPIELDLNSIELVKYLMLPDGTIVFSDTVALVWIRFNRPDNPWIPFSLIANNGDKQVANLTIKKMWIKVGQVGTGFKTLVFIGSLNASLSGAQNPIQGGVTGGGYVSSPTTLST